MAHSTIERQRQLEREKPAATVSSCSAFVFSRTTSVDLDQLGRVELRIVVKAANLEAYRLLVGVFVFFPFFSLGKNTRTTYDAPLPTFTCRQIYSRRVCTTPGHKLPRGEARLVQHNSCSLRLHIRLLLELMAVVMV